MMRAGLMVCFIFWGMWGLSAEHKAEEKVDFVYVHGFGERRFPPAFERKSKEYVDENKLPANVFTYRWDAKKLNPFIVLKQWKEAKQNADKEGVDFAENVLKKYEEAGQKYVIVAYSLGTRVVTKSFEHYNKPLKSLAGIYFLGAALDNDFKVKQGVLPEGMKIVNYYSSVLDGALTISYSIREGKDPGGETGFKDEEVFTNYRTVCTHVYKGGPIQRDYSNLHEAIIDMTFFKEKVERETEELNFNIEMAVWNGRVHWNDVLKVPAREKCCYLFQHNVNTNHYRVVWIDDKGGRCRKGWSGELFALLQRFGKLQD